MIIYILLNTYYSITVATKAAFTDALLQKYMYQSERGCSAVDKAGNRADKTNNNGNFKRVFLKLS